MADDEQKEGNSQAPEIPPGPPLSKGGEVDTDTLVDEWLAQYFPASLITRDSAGWQHILAATEELKRRLKGVES